MKKKMSPQEKKRLLFVIVFAALLLVGVNGFWWFTTGRPYVELLRTPQKIYVPIPLAPTPAAIGTQTVDTANTESPALPGVSESLETSEKPESINDTAASVTDDKTPVTGITAEHNHSHEDHSAESEAIRTRIAESKALRQDARELLESSRAEVKENMPLFVNELNKLSVEDQRRLLTQIKDNYLDNFFDMLPAEIRPEMREVMTPDIVETSWLTFLDLLVEAGYTPPEGIY